MIYRKAQVPPQALDVSLQQLSGCPTRAGNSVLSQARTIIVIAPDLGLRQSLTFALEVEGYHVEAHESWRKGTITAGQTLCMIIDDQVLRASSDALQRLLQSGEAVILLTDGMSPSIEDELGPIQSLTKPFNGADLLGLVKDLALTA
ncbi:Transcriptional regulator protein FixT [Neorhizobium galegae bv. officinalis bv. officinalis str. HAMBI 1141]|uniref:Transcriptional regulator protein FixT n=1 Tax=Neorhizobium galegae bv. officinalis bv. officinalis str. HAMBI 1141 TaxID=1028801 RepID=A0A068T8Q0_NEOGA|nr:Transcriptional regulator protein FixT [Neorhizobium galegae bv. officinalis bv. officinalis str. HAMBI 1141]